MTPVCLAEPSPMARRPKGAPWSSRIGGRGFACFADFGREFCDIIFVTNCKQALFVGPPMQRRRFACKTRAKEDQLGQVILLQIAGRFRPSGIT
jgi:hypothetical protein